MTTTASRSTARLRYPIPSTRSAAFSPPIGTRCLIDGHDQAAVLRELVKAKSAIGRASSPARRQSDLARRPRPARARRMARRLAPRRSPARARRCTGPTSPSWCPTTILAAWRAVGARAAAPHARWRGLLEARPAAQRAEFERRIRGDLPAGARRRPSTPISASSPRKRPRSPPARRRRGGARRSSRPSCPN